MVSSGPPYDFESVSNNADSHQLLAVVAAVHHERVGQTLDDGAVGLAESLGGISASRVRYVDWGPDLNVVAAMIAPLASVLRVMFSSSFSSFFLVPFSAMLLCLARKIE